MGCNYLSMMKFSERGTWRQTSRTMEEERSTKDVSVTTVKSVSSSWPLETFCCLVTEERGPTTTTTTLEDYNDLNVNKTTVRPNLLAANFPWCSAAPAILTLPPQSSRSLCDLAGALNYWYAECLCLVRLENWGLLHTGITAPIGSWGQWNLGPDSI